MAHPTSHDELLEMGFQLSYFIHRDKAVALRIATAALEKLDAADSRQDKRRYYNPSGQRRKVSLPELLLLQRLVYTESEPHEKRREQSAAAPPNQAMMVKHFIKHLVKITIRRNSFHVTLGLARLLHDYTTAETAELHNVVVQDAERVPEDGYYRSRKAVLMGELKDRFGAMLPVERGARGRERFQTQDSRRFARLARECLQAFTPWQTRCCVPARFNPATNELDDLSFRGNDPDEEHKTEVNRYHALLHPPCFELLALALGYDAPAARLAIPRFLLAAAHQDDDSDAGGGSSPGLSDEDRDSVRRYLGSQSGRRLASTAGLLHFVVDGETLGTLDPQQAGEISFAIPRSAEFIEIRTVDREGELLLAVHTLEADEHSDLAEQQAEVALPGERSFKLSITPTRDAEGEVSGATVRAISLAKQPARSTSAWTLGGWLKPALALLALAVVAGLIYFFAGQSTPPQPAITEASPTPAPSPQTSPLVAQQSPTSAPTPQPNVTPALPPGDQVIAINIPASKSSTLDDLTRGEREQATATSLLSARKLFVEIKGDEALRRRLDNQIRQQLQTAGKFAIVANSGDAEIALKLTVRQKDGRAIVDARIVNADGKVIWPLTTGISGRRYTGAAEKVALQFSSDLLDDLNQLERRR